MGIPILSNLKICHCKMKYLFCEYDFFFLWTQFWNLVRWPTSLPTSCLQRPARSLDGVWLSTSLWFRQTQATPMFLLLDWVPRYSTTIDLEMTQSLIVTQRREKNLHKDCFPSTCCIIHSQYKLHMKVIKTHESRGTKVSLQSQIPSPRRLNLKATIPLFPSPVTVKYLPAAERN